MSTALVTLFGAAGAVAAMLGVIVPLILAQGKALRREIDAQGAELRQRIDAQGAELRQRIDAQGAELRREIDALRPEIDALRGDMGRLRAEVAELRRDLHGLSDRVARIEGALTGPWRPTNGSPTPEARPAPATPEMRT